MIIDFHTHTFPASISEKVMKKLGQASAVQPATDGSAAGLAASMKNAGVDYSVNLPVMTSPEQVSSVNDKLISQKEELMAEGIITFGGLHPDFENYKEELRKLKQEGIAGIKLHPAYQGVDLNDIRMKRIISAASELDLIVLIHAGVDIGIYDRNYSPVSQVLEILDEIRPPKFVLAHMGSWACWDDVEKYVTGAPLWMDSAFTIGPITPYPGVAPGPYSQCTMDDDQFLRIARKHGMSRILFATDCPWQDQKRYVARFNELPMTPEEKEMFFHGNAQHLLGPYH